MKKRRIIQLILWTEWPTGAVMGAGSLSPLNSKDATGKLSLTIWTPATEWWRARLQ